MVSKKRKKISMKNFKRFLQQGQISRLLLVLAAIVLVAVVITYLVMKMAEPPPNPTPPADIVPQPVYSQKLGDIAFTYRSAIDIGNTLRASDALNTSSWQKDITSTERFIKVTIGAQNEGKANIQENSWDLGDIVDSEGRIFEPVSGYSISSWLPLNNGCKNLLKPAFEPTLCTKIYEVSKKSSGLKINVLSGKENTASNFSSKKIDSALLDLIVK